MEQWVQIVIAAASFLVACVVAIVGILALVNSRANRMEDKIETARNEAQGVHSNIDAKIDKLNDNLSTVTAEVAELRGWITGGPLGPGPLSIHPSKRKRKAS